MKRISPLGIILLISGSLYAHDLWLEEEDGAVRLLYGHKYSSHKGTSIMEYSPEYVLYVRCQQRDKIVDVDVEKRYPLTLTSDCDVYYVLFSSGYWTKTVYGTKNVSKEGQSQVLKSWQSFESVKYVKGFSDKHNRSITDDLEIVPLSDLIKIRSGDKLRLQVFYKGRPLKDVVVAYNGKPRGNTDENGKINVIVKEKGFQMISASISEKGDGVKCDEIIRTTNLNFVVKE